MASRDRFNRAAATYRTDRCPGRAACARAVLEALAPAREDVVLDVACGPGAQLVELAPSIRSGFGIDPAERMNGQGGPRTAARTSPSA